MNKDNVKSYQNRALSLMQYFMNKKVMKENG